MMKSSKGLAIKFSLSILAIACIVGCGVKGDPVPPGTPAELGRGKPNYKRATEDLAFPVVAPPYPVEDGLDRDQEGEK